jgi:Trypsin-like peptidase domain
MAGVAKILLANTSHIPNSLHAGMGIILDRRHVLTCAHVVNRSLGKDFSEVAKSANPIPVTFPKLTGPLQTKLGRVQRWSPIGSAFTSDLAVLEFSEDLPAVAGSALFADDGTLRIGDTVRAFGVKDGEAEGTNVRATYNGDVENDLGQIDAGPDTQAFIAGGYSGAAATDNAGKVVGMITARYEGSELIAFMVHSKTLRAFLGIKPPLELRPDQGPLIVHTYSLLDTKLFGRRDQIEDLNNWARSDAIFAMLENHGGFGKSALAYTWFQQQFPVSNPTHYWDGGIWYSFYEASAGYRDFLEHLCSYCSGASFQDLSGLSLEELEGKVEHAMRRYHLLVVLDGFEAMLNAYDILATQDAEFKTTPTPSTNRNERSIASTDFANFLLDILKKGQGRSKILFTTRLMPTEFETKHGQPKEGINRFELTGLDVNGARDYWQACGLNYSDPDLPRFVDEIGGHPLALSIMAAVMSSSKRPTIAKFREFDPEFDPRGDLRNGRNDVFQAALRRLTEQQRVLLVRIASYRQPAPLDELEKMFVSSDWRGSDTCFVGRDELIRALDSLQNLRLIGYQTSERSYDMHPVVRGVVRLRTTASDWYEATEAIVEELEKKPSKFDVRSLKDISDEILIFRCKVDLGHYQEAALRYAGDEPGSLRPALRKLGEVELEAELIGEYFKINQIGHRRTIEFNWDGNESTGLTAKTDFAQVLANARNAKGEWEEALEFRSLHRSSGLCQDPMCDSWSADTLRALGRLAEAERIFVRCRTAVRKFSQDKWRKSSNWDPYRRSMDYDHVLNYASYRLAWNHFSRAVSRHDAAAARLSFVRGEAIRARKPARVTYWFENERELLRARNLNLAAVARIEKRPDRALFIAREVFKKAEDEGHLADEAAALLSMARSYLDIKDFQLYSKAESCVKDSLEIVSRKQQSRNTSSAWRLLVDILIQAKRLDEAEQVLTQIEERAEAWSDVYEEARVSALHAKLCDARGQRDEAIEHWFLVLDKLTIEPGAPSDDPMIFESMAELEKRDVLSQSRRRGLNLGPPAKDGWLTINPFDRYWTPWFGVGPALSPNWR